MNSTVEQANHFWLCAISSSTINSTGDAVGWYTGIKLSLLSAKYCRYLLKNTV
jgi:hypothetical protein